MEEQVLKILQPLFSKWAHWYEQQERYPIAVPISDIANFLPELYQEG